MNALTEKYSALISRWNKIIVDTEERISERDSSKYQKMFLSEHQFAVSQSNRPITELKQIISDRLRASKALGSLDALNFMLLELNQLVESV